MLSLNRGIDNDRSFFDYSIHYNCGKGGNKIIAKVQEMGI